MAFWFSISIKVTSLEQIPTHYNLYKVNALLVQIQYTITTFLVLSRPNVFHKNSAKIKLSVVSQKGIIATPLIIRRAQTSYKVYMTLTPFWFSTLYMRFYGTVKLKVKYLCSSDCLFIHTFNQILKLWYLSDHKVILPSILWAGLSE